jgi:outer membrane protein OmpA-like peptidoglycan-associated protein
LISQGIPQEKIRATGLGSGRPIADNATAEGRANNRRVEIVVEPER